MKQRKHSRRKRDDLEGNREIPIDHLYFVKPLKGKKSKEVLQALQEIVLQLRMDNLPVVRIHSDRAHELRSPSLREWSLNNNILLTRTEGQAPQSNGTAERAVRFLKGKARLMLRSANLGPSHWATAMITAAHHQRQDRLCPEEYIPPCPYGAKVAIKKKRYKDGGKHDLLPHWVKGTYLGPVWDVKNGSAVLDHEAGRITVTTHIRPRLHDPGSAADAPATQFEPPTRRRLTTKTPVDEDGLALRRLQGKEKQEARQELVKEIMNMIREGPARPPKRPQLVEAENGPNGSYVTYGAFNHGGRFGVTNQTAASPELTKKLTRLLRMDFPDEVFTSATVVKESMMPPHKDVYNDKDTNNLVSPLIVPKRAGVWQEMIPGDEFHGCYQQREVKGKELPGQFFSLNQPVKVNPRRYHAPVQGEEGARIVVAGHTIGSWRKLSEEMVAQLEDCGFLLPQEVEQPSAKAVTTESSNDGEYNYEMDEESILEDFVSQEPMVEVEQEILMVRKAAVENLYTYDIEKVLQKLDEELRKI